MDTEKCPLIGIDCEYIPLARKSDAQAKETERLRKALKKICHVTGSDMEAYIIAENALKEKE